MKYHARLLWIALFSVLLLVCGVSADEKKRNSEPLERSDEINEILTMEQFDAAPILIGRDTNEKVMELYRSFPGAHDHNSEGRGFKSRLMIMWNLVDYLNLDEDTAASFFPIFNEHTQKRDKLTKSHREIVNQIITEVEKEDISTGELTTLVDKLEDIAEQNHNERKEFLEKAKKILDDRQYVKMVIFNDKLKKDLFGRFSSRRNSFRSPVESIKGYELLPGTDFNRSTIEYRKRINEHEETLKSLYKQLDKLNSQKEKMGKDKE